MVPVKSSSKEWTSRDRSTPTSPGPNITIENGATTSTTLDGTFEINATTMTEIRDAVFDGALYIAGGGDSVTLDNVSNTAGGNPDTIQVMAANSGTIGAGTTLTISNSTLTGLIDSHIDLIRDDISIQNSTITASTNIDFVDSTYATTAIPNSVLIDTGTTIETTNDVVRIPGTTSVTVQGGSTIRAIDSTSALLIGASPNATPSTGTVLIDGSTIETTAPSGSFFAPIQIGEPGGESGDITIQNGAQIDSAEGVYVISMENITINGPGTMLTAARAINLLADNDMNGVGDLVVSGGAAVTGEAISVYGENVRILGGSSFTRKRRDRIRCHQRRHRRGGWVFDCDIWRSIRFHQLYHGAKSGLHHDPELLPAALPRIHRPRGGQRRRDHRHPGLHLEIGAGSTLEILADDGSIEITNSSVGSAAGRGTIVIGTDQAATPVEADMLSIINSTLIGETIRALASGTGNELLVNGSTFDATTLVAALCGGGRNPPFPGREQHHRPRRRPRGRDRAGGCRRIGEHQRGRQHLPGHRELQRPRVRHHRSRGRLHRDALRLPAGF